MEVEVKEYGVRIRLVVEPYHPDTLDLDTAVGLGGLDDLELEPSGPQQVGENSAEAVKTMVADSPLPPVARPELERTLRNWRREEAIRRGVPTYIIMTERTIKSIVEHPPEDLVQLHGLKGIGPKTMELYGDALLSLIGQVEEE